MHLINIVSILAVVKHHNAQLLDPDQVLDCGVLDEGEECAGIPDEPNAELGPDPNRKFGAVKRSKQVTYTDLNRECGAHYYETYYCEPKKDQKKCVKTKFYGYKEYVTYEVAKQKCALTRGRRLVSVLNKETWGNLKKFIKGFGKFHYWTSAFRNTTTGELYWGNECPIKYTVWASGEPTLNMDGYAEDCVAIRPNLQWNDDVCQRKKFYICEENGCDRHWI